MNKNIFDFSNIGAPANPEPQQSEQLDALSQAQILAKARQNTAKPTVKPEPKKPLTAHWRDKPTIN